MIAKTNLIAAAKSTGNSELVRKVERWHQMISQGNFLSMESLKLAFPSVDRVGERLVFNLGSYRLIAGFSFRSQVVYFKHLLTHDEYMRMDWR